MQSIARKLGSDPGTAPPVEVAINHVSVLVHDVRAAAAPFVQAGHAVGEFEAFEAEGTDEVYLGPPDSGARLLLQAPHGPGPYLRAYQKRGAGLHHIALDVSDLPAFAARMGEIGWLLHPVSLLNFQKQRPVFFARPGVPVLLEVAQQAPVAAEAFINRVLVPVVAGNERFITDLNLPALQAVSSGGFSIRIGSTAWRLVAGQLVAD
ncbi:MAG: hypothetical protein A2087_11260 [Spirochaetes bacterium GWD1_61_31]|nr:MAG: hypothetical protein A2Y37_01260 [Spirochaetes bacterium GWB1_60_80]OHD35695.1 MAG: hypothetical protein A2087_11260 [Spirochaetes bacterium GWD1_61_31]HAP42589.1 hypothetical protein [Spirochaetaceae bacterium]HAW84956.1 hypothetical protein [Spirochaetaceae bacterium]HAX38278.1 hypothetical protein [Spirochaetaceae bacterium]